VVFTIVYSKAGIDYRAAGGSIMLWGGREMKTSVALFLNEPTCTSVLSTAVGQFTLFWKCAPADELMTPCPHFPRKRGACWVATLKAEIIYQEGLLSATYSNAISKINKAINRAF
jgi:hypothetical protein